MPSDRLLIFAKPPVAGVVKTRLSPALPAAEAARVYEACLRDVIALATRERGRVEVWHSGGVRAGRFFARAFPHVVRRAQGRGGLGTRMADAFGRSFADGGERVVLMGSDSPTLPDALLTSAFHELREAGGVIGPTLDGGYYLIGLCRAVWPEAAVIFEGMRWSTPEVLAATLERTLQAGLDVRLLPAWYDVDVPADLVRARADAAGDSHLGRWLAGDTGLRYVPG
jgi:rSAM/selenodomain-associated transferase 1